jgi:hypothetical protein
MVELVNHEALYKVNLVRCSSFRVADQGRILPDPVYRHHEDQASKASKRRSIRRTLIQRSSTSAFCRLMLRKGHPQLWRDDGIDEQRVDSTRRCKTVTVLYADGCDVTGWWTERLFMRSAKRVVRFANEMWWARNRGNTAVRPARVNLSSSAVVFTFKRMRGRCSNYRKKCVRGCNMYTCIYPWTQRQHDWQLEPARPTDSPLTVQQSPYDAVQSSRGWPLISG